MAARLITQTIDDISGEPGAAPVRFGLDGKAYEIDLTPAHRRAMLGELAPWIAAARKVARRHVATGMNGGLQRAAIRAWARDQGISVADRGRLSAALIARYRAAGNGR